MKRTLCFIIILASLIPIGCFIHTATYAQQNTATNFQPLTVSGTWNAHNYDLVYTITFSSQEQPHGPLVVYRASASDLRTSVPVIAVARNSQAPTPLFFPSPDGQYLALLTPQQHGYGTELNGATLRILSTDGRMNSLLVPRSVTAGDQIVWSANSSALYYHSSMQERSFNTWMTKSAAYSASHQISRDCTRICSGYDEIHRIDLQGHDSILLHQNQDDSSLRMVGVERSGALILTWARPQHPVALLRLATSTNLNTLHGNAQSSMSVIATLPPDILPGNVLRVGSDGTSIECERVFNWNPLRYTLMRISFANSTQSSITPIFDTTRFGHALTPLNRSSDGQVLVMSQMTGIRADLAAQGIADVPAQENLLVADAISGATERLALPAGGQIVLAFWTAHMPMEQVHTVPPAVLARLLALHKVLIGGGQQNASVFQQDEWMLEGHAGKLVDAPILPTMCYGYCPHGAIGAPHVSAAILHGVAYTESNWHQFNTADYRVNGEPIGSPIESWDGGWGEFQQTWGMPPQCFASNNCRADAVKIQQEQSYNIGVGVQSLISAWNGTAGVVSSADPNDPYKANHWFFAVWAYNGAYGNNPNDVPSSVYGHWYPGAPFRSIYEEYVWYYAAHPQYQSNGWTDNYLPSLGSSLLPPQSDFANTSDSVVGCVTCTIPDWTSGSFDRDWVGMGAANTTSRGYFQSLFTQSSGEDVVGLPRDNGGSAAVHRWAAGWTQDFGGGAYLPGAFMLADNTTSPYWVYGGVWAQYLTADHGAIGCHRYPTSALTPFTNPSSGSDSYLRQTFQSGYIVWDATTQMVVADVCG